MDLIHDLAARLLMKPVDILCDDAVEFALLLHLRQLYMRSVGLAVPCVHLLPVELEEDLGLVIETAAAQKVLGLIPVKPHIMLVVQPVLAPEIGNAALRGYAGTSEKGDMT